MVQKGVKRTVPLTLAVIHCTILRSREYALFAERQATNFSESVCVISQISTEHAVHCYKVIVTGGVQVQHLDEPSNRAD